MEERFVRCRRCHDVFEAGQANCPRCGAAYVAVTDASAEGIGSYAEKYQGSGFAEVVEAPQVASGGRSGMGLVLAIGAGLIVVAVAVSGLVLMGAFEMPSATPTAEAVIARPATPTPVPTLPPIVTKALDGLADPKLNMHVSIRTTVSINARANPNGRSEQTIVNMEVDCAGGNEQGTDQNGAVTYEWRLVDGTYFLRRLPSGAWKAQTGFSPFVVLSPLFSLTEARMLQYDGPDTKNGVETDKLESTRWWTPDTGKLSGLDVAALDTITRPQQTRLQLWVASDGAPVYAIFRAWTDASDKTNLLDITTTYTFTNQGAVQPIPSPSIK